MASKIVIVEDDPITLKRIRHLMEKDGFRVAAYSRPHPALDHIRREPCDLIISDIHLPFMNGFELMTQAMALPAAPECILITGFASINDAVHATKEGAFHYLAKPFSPETLRKVVAQALEQRTLRNPPPTAPDGEHNDTAPEIIGESPSIRLLRETIAQIAPTDCNVLVTGESGTGKELVARAIHCNSGRSRLPFVAFNCGALTESLINNELFGHEKGAFTGADTRTPGLLETAHGGTVFFDEIGEMPPSMQVSLLRVIQEGELLRVGGRKPIPVNVRIIAATADNLKTAVEEGIFRRDFYYRINVVSLHVPSLHERREDIPPLAYHILNNINRNAVKPISAISTDAMQLLSGYAFPGNVRELENILRRAVAVCPGDVIRVADLPPDLAELELRTYHRPEHTLVPLDAIEEDYIVHVLAQTGGNRAKAAKILGIDRTSLWRKMKKLGLQ